MRSYRCWDRSVWLYEWQNSLIWNFITRPNRVSSCIPKVTTCSSFNKTASKAIHCTITSNKQAILPSYYQKVTIYPLNCSRQLQMTRNSIGLSLSKIKYLQLEQLLWPWLWWRKCLLRIRLLALWIMGRRRGMFLRRRRLNNKLKS